jgi:hypothetical protein
MALVCWLAGAGCPLLSAPASLLQQFLDGSKGYAALPRSPYTPAFRLEAIPPPDAKGSEWYYLCDGPQRIGLTQTWICEIELFRFFPAAPGQGEPYPIPPVYHWANLHGARIQMYGRQMLPADPAFRLTFTRKEGETIEFTTENVHREGGIHGTNQYRLAWDQRLGYVVYCHSRYSMAEPRAIEFNNLLAGGISDARAEHKRWQKTVRTLVDGKIGFVYHSPLHVPTDEIAAGGFVGYITEERMNPFVELLETDTPVSISTCSQWYDQHIVLKPPAQRGADGLYHTQARYRFLSLPGAVARELEQVAVDQSPEAGPSGVPGFLPGTTNDFETTVPREGLYLGPIWRNAKLSETFAHSGKSSLRLRGAGAGREVSISPTGGGPAVYGESSKRYRLSAWVKTRGLLDGGAYLQVDDVFWSWSDQRATRRSTPVGGNQDWTRVELCFQPSANDPFLLIKLCVAGSGSAWFDDLALMAW